MSNVVFKETVIRLALFMTNLSHLKSTNFIGWEDARVYIGSMIFFGGTFADKSAMLDTNAFMKAYLLEYCLNTWQAHEYFMMELI